MKKLKLQINLEHINDPRAKYQTGELNNFVIFTPPIGEDYWLYRVNLFEDQSIIAFTKFGTIGIGFEIEDDWNTNLPYSEKAEQICQHIWHNRKYIAIKRKRTIRAIEMIQERIKSCVEFE